MGEGRNVVYLAVLEIQAEGGGGDHKPYYLLGKCGIFFLE